MSWTLWCDQDGQIHFQNRKPFVMDGGTGEIGDVADVPTGVEITDDDIMSLSSAYDEKNLRNRVIVRGQGVSGEASAVSPYLPSGFYKTAALGAPQLIDDADMAQEVAEINLEQFNHLTHQVEATIEGSPAISARQVLRLNSAVAGINELFYVLNCTTNITNQGYVNSLILRRVL